MSRRRYVRVDPEPYHSWWMETYGGPEGLLEGMPCFQRGKNDVWIASPGVEPGRLVPVDGVGIPFARIGRRVWKPAGAAVQQFGAVAERNVLEATPEEAATILSGGTVRPEPDDPRIPADRRGHAIVRRHGIPVGCALWRGRDLESCVPKGRRLVTPDLPASSPW